MSVSSMSFKAKINNYAKEKHIPAQVVLQNMMFERFLERLSKSKYKENFIIKGGMLISALVGLDTRATMDLDTTIRKLSLTEEKVTDTITDICNIVLDDNISFRLKSTELIRKDDVYGGFRVKLEAIFEQIVTPLSVDISTGDIITPEAVKYKFRGIMDNSMVISLWGYSIETILAEKVETILSRGVTNTRPRDFYDVYIISKEKIYDPIVFFKALRATSENRGTWRYIENYEPIIKQIAQNDFLKELWDKYRKEFDYARDISYNDTIYAIIALLKKA